MLDGLSSLPTSLSSFSPCFLSLIYLPTYLPVCLFFYPSIHHPPILLPTFSSRTGPPVINRWLTLLSDFPVFSWGPWFVSSGLLNMLSESTSIRCSSSFKNVSHRSLWLGGWCVHLSLPHTSQRNWKLLQPHVSQRQLAMRWGPPGTRSLCGPCGDLRPSSQRCASARASALDQRALQWRE